MTTYLMHNAKRANKADLYSPFNETGLLWRRLHSNMSEGLWGAEDLTPAGFFATQTPCGGVYYVEPCNKHQVVLVHDEVNGQLITGAEPYEDWTPVDDQPRHPAELAAMGYLSYKDEVEYLEALRNMRYARAVEAMKELTAYPQERPQGGYTVFERGCPGVGSLDMPKGNSEPVIQSAFEEQVDGNHYKDSPEGYQPFQISKALGLNPVEHTILKYLLRHRTKSGERDLQKLIHCTKILIEQEYS